MRAFTIATGAYLELALVTASCFEWSTGIEPTIVTDVAEPYEAKLGLANREQYVFFDADLLLRKQWAIPEVPLDTFAAAPLQFHDRGLREIAKRHQLPKPMLSAGLFIASREHAPAMVRALELMRIPNESKAREETWLNVALQELATPLLTLPQDVNTQRVTSAHATGLHFCTESGVEAKLAAVRHHLTNHAPDELRAFLRDRGVGDFVRPVLTGPRALSAAGRFPMVAVVGESDFAKSRRDGLAEVMRSHRAAVAVSKAKDVAKLVRKEVDEKNRLA